MPKLRLGPIPSDKPVTRMVKLSAVLDADLRAYAEVYAGTFGVITVERLIPAMLERFLRSDRGFRSRSQSTNGSAPMSPPPEQQG
ncbi:MAG: DUF2274 domain-containing protein [Rhodopila sp.]|nr:DUF2274 domain-containing protein [Rhodopila sp.]